MVSVVVDASAVLQLWLDPAGADIGARLAGETLYAPAHLRIEAANVVRRQRNAGALTDDAARMVFGGIMRMPVRLWPFEAIAERAWQLGMNATTHDAAYLALAEHLDLPLVTHDAKLARVPAIRCAVEVF